VENFCKQTTESGVFQKRRRSQMRDWLHSMIEDQLKAYFFTHPAVRGKLSDIEQAVMDGNIPATAAASELLRTVAHE
jgi:LAO/AO transport system kinase